MGHYAIVHRQTDRQKDRKTDRRTDRQTETDRRPDFIRQTVRAVCVYLRGRGGEGPREGGRERGKEGGREGGREESLREGGRKKRGRTSSQIGTCPQVFSLCLHS